MNSVRAFDPLCEVQSDKASVEITSPFDGVVKELLVNEGNVAKVGEAICTIEIEEDDAPENPSQATENSLSPQKGHAHTSSLTDVTAGSNNLDQDKPLQRRPHPLDPNVSQESEITEDKNVLATPSVRHFARASGVNLANIRQGSGRDGRIEKKDVEAFLSAQTPSHSKPSANTSSAPETDITVELGRTRYGMWKAMEKVSCR